jgi:hypothetical protein
VSGRQENQGLTGCLRAGRCGQASMAPCPRDSPRLPSSLHLPRRQTVVSHLHCAALHPAVCRHQRFLLMYLAAAVAGNVASFYGSTAPSLGASGAIFGVGGALAMYFYRNRWVRGGGAVLVAVQQHNFTAGYAACWLFGCTHHAHVITPGAPLPTQHRLLTTASPPAPPSAFHTTPPAGTSTASAATWCCASCGTPCSSTCCTA